MLIDWISAFTPILVILVLMVRFRWGAAKAGPAGWMAAVAVAAARFGAGINLLALVQVKAFLLSIDVLLIKRKFPPLTITIPSADEVIRKGDLLVLAGLAENIKKIEKATE